MTAVAVLDRVYARDGAGPRGRARGTLHGVSLELGAGVNAILGAPEDGTLALFDVLTGARAPQRGRVSVAGRDPGRAPSVRARMGVLAPEPCLPSAPTVREAVRLAMRARGESGARADAALDALGLAHLQGRGLRSLAFAEERAVELALALSAPAPALLVLHDPLADVAVASPAQVAARLREVSATGACVVLTTSSPSDARALGEQVLVLQRGLLIGRAGAAAGEALELRVWLRGGARELLASLLRRPEVTGVAWEDAQGWLGAQGVRVKGAGEACALAVAEAALEVGAEVVGIEERSLSLGEVKAATEALWRTSRQAAASPPAKGTG